MQCPSCQHTDSRVLESRAADGGRSVRRRRECLNCDFRFTTYERVETVPITVVKRNGSRETFNRVKLLHGLLRACEKTGLEPGQLEVVVDDLELALQQRSGREVSSTEIGELVLERLRGMSEVAYVRFASVYRQFRSVSDFVATWRAWAVAGSAAAAARATDWRSSAEPRRLPSAGGRSSIGRVMDRMCSAGGQARLHPFVLLSAAAPVP